MLLNIRINLSLVLLIKIFLHSVFARVPDDLSPINVFTASETNNYPVFLGTPFGNTNLTGQLHNFQGMKKIGNNFYIYAREAIFVVSAQPWGSETDSLNLIPYKQEIVWVADDDTVRLCEQKGASKEDCQSYIKLLQVDVPAPDSEDRAEKRIIICSTNAFKPDCRIYSLIADGELVYTGDSYDDALVCPHSPKQSSISLLSDGNLYTATVSGFSGDDPVLVRSARNSSLIKLRTPTKDKAIFNDPKFIRFIDVPSKDKILVFFTEVAMEDQSHKIFSRVGQACKSDIGGDNLLSTQFSSFFKARLNCSSPGKPPFYFNEMTDVTNLVTVDPGYKTGNKQFIFALMNTPGNSVPASAICAFTVDDIEATLTGAFMEKYTRESTGNVYWEKQETYPLPHLARCDRSADELNDNNLNFIKKHPLLYNSVPAWSFKRKSSKESSPLFTRTAERTFMTTFVVDSKAGVFSNYTVFIAGTEDGKIVKILLLESGETLLVEQRSVFNQEKCSGNKAVRQIVIDQKSASMMIAFENCVVDAPLCPLLNNKCSRACIESRDPYCALNGERCVSVSSQSPKKSNLKQDLNRGYADDLPTCVASPVGESNGKDDSNINGESQLPSNKTESANNQTVTAGVGETADSQKQAGVFPLYVAAIICFIIGVLCGFLFIYLRKRYCLRKEKDYGDEEESSSLNEKPKEKNESKRASRYSNQSCQRQNSNSSGQNNKQGGPQVACVDPVSRQRTITGNSGRNEEGVIIDKPQHRNEPAGTPKASQHYSTTSSGGSKHRSRLSRPSVNSNPDQPEVSLDDSERHPSPNSDQNLEDPFSDDANEEAKPRSFENNPSMHKAPQPVKQNYYADIHSLQNGRKTRAPPNRSQSMVSSHRGQSQTVDPRYRPMNRQHSYIPNYPNHTPHFTPSNQPPPNTNFGTVRPLQMDPNATPRKGFNGTDYTRSLDRSRKSGVKKYHIPPPNNYDEQIHQQPHFPNSTNARRRGASESEKNTRTPTYCPPANHIISEEEEVPLLVRQNSQKPKPNFKLDLSKARHVNASQPSPYAVGGSTPPVRAYPNGHLRDPNGMAPMTIAHAPSNPSTPIRYFPKQFSTTDSRGLPFYEARSSSSNPSSPNSELPPSAFPGPERTRHPSGKTPLQPFVPQTSPYQDPSLFMPGNYQRGRHVSGGAIVRLVQTPSEERNRLPSFSAEQTSTPPMQAVG